MEEIILRFPYLAEDIFQNLNNEGLVKCREGGRVWQKFIDERNYPWIRIVHVPTVQKNGMTYLHLAVETGKLIWLTKL